MKSGPPIFGTLRAGFVEAIFVAFNVIATEIVFAIMAGWAIPDRFMTGIAKFFWVFIPLSAIGMGIRAGHREWIRSVRRHRRACGKCVHCGYDLHGNESGECPECGQPTLRY